VAAISYCVTLLNAQAFVVISSEMATNEASARDSGADPRLARALPGRVLHPRASYSKDRRIVLCHETEKSRFTLTCATDNALEGSCPHSCLSTPLTSAKSRSPSTRSPAVHSN
jgi:alpha,alpha-trehalose phosphorylase